MADTRVDLHGKIRDALRSMRGDDFSEQASRLLGVLGYRSERTVPGQSGAVDEFLSRFPAENPGTKSEQEFGDAISSVRVLFQVADQEVEEAGGSLLLFRDNAFDKGNARSFIFTAVQLRGDGYPRGRYAAYTREINKRFPRIPAVVLFRTAAGRITLAFVHVRPNKRNPERNVLGSVSLIREVKTDDPHRAHVDILAELALEERLQWMRFQRRPINFDGLLAAWLDALDTEELNRRFYRALKDWFDRAVDEARFPKTGPRVLQSEEHVIRLITRLLFVWFVKEKGLVADELFIEAQVRGLLKDYDADDGDSYYRAVLQNLFFATLNTEIGRRGFSSGANPTHRDFSRYRYRAEMSDPDALRAYFDKTPFINGGLFDCLDSEEATGQRGYRIDYFSDNAIVRGTAEYGKLSIPNRLFFDNDGLITLFNHYKFTVEENTPAEQEVALDPELLGKVFENLLAAYNPETKESARKQTGSYYTPRAVVDYMVDEALVASLAQKAQPADGDAGFWQERLRYLLDYNDAFEDAASLFVESEAEQVIGAIAGLRVLDPAVGSGAFPMGVLHKLTLALRRLDPDNRRWEALQKAQAGAMAAAAFDSGTRRDRDQTLDDISETFERYRDSDFGRKLYLIQNSIYGVDIQPVATQIAKLRFFISLAIDQQPAGDRDDNYGIRPLPNLETRFVAANTLLGLGAATQIPLGGQNRVTELNDQLRGNREGHFHAGARQEKLRLRREDARLRGLLAQGLRKAGMTSSDANKVAHWDPYDQNAHADWFDAGYMFDISDGFDVVIGNPPYVQVPKGMHSAAQFPYAEGRDKGKQNLYKLFVEQSYNLCKPGGLATQIVQSSLMCDLSSAATRQLLLDHTRLRHLIEFPKAAPTREAQLFQSVTQGTCVYQFTKVPPDGKPISISVGNDAHTIADLRFVSITRAAIVALYPHQRCFPRIKGASVATLERIAVDQSIKPLQHYAATIAQGDLNLTIHSKRFSHNPTSVRLLRGRNVGRYVIKYDGSSEYCDKGFMTDQVDVNRQEAFLISQEVTGTNDIRRLHFGLAEHPPTDFLCGHSVNKTQLNKQEHSKAFLALLNSKFMDWFFRITSTNNHVQGYELEQLPIPAMTSMNRESLTNLADRILAAKRTKPSADTSVLEGEVDRLVYALYGLTEEEIAVVEGR